MKEQSQAMLNIVNEIKKLSFEKLKPKEWYRFEIHFALGEEIDKVTVKKCGCYQVLKGAR